MRSAFRSKSPPTQEGDGEEGDGKTYHELMPPLGGEARGLIFLAVHLWQKAEGE
jgi:hypothetical protein